MGILSALIGWLGYHLGLRTDAASATGSLHAKIENIVTNLIPTLQKPRAVHGVYGSLFNGVDTSYTTALNVSGKGKLTRLSAVTDALSPAYVKITVDGTIVAWGRATASSGAYHYPTSFMFFQVIEDDKLIFDTVANGGNAINAEISYKSSLKIETKPDTNGHIQLYWQYEHE